MSRPIVLILDTSAILEYARQSIHVGEVMTEVADEGGLVGVPLPCLVEASPFAVDAEALNLLVGNPVVELLSQDPESWRMLAQARALIGDYPSAAAVLHAVDLEAFLLTRSPDRYEFVDNGSMVIRIGD